MLTIRRCMVPFLALLLCRGSAHGAEPVVSGARRLIQPFIERHLAEPLAATRTGLRTAARYPVMFRVPCRTHAAKDPWKGLSELEAAGRTLARLAGGGAGQIGPLLRTLLAASGNAGDAADGQPSGAPPSTLDEIVERLQAADAYRTEALAKLAEKDRAFLLTWPATMVRTYGPQLPVNQKMLPLLTNTRAFTAFAGKHYNWPALLRAAEALVSIADPAALAAVRAAVRGRDPVRKNPEGVSGRLLLVRETDLGWLIVGGRGPNTYDLAEPPALLVDLGGKDTYTGMIAASASAAHPHSVVIDVEGDDTYKPAAFGLATGRCGGVGLLVDMAGADTYELATGSGGVGFGGIGVLVDCRGDDVYTGRKYTQGAAMAGLGLLLDLAGDDTYTSFGRALGFAGPAAAAAVVDVDGDDSYQCGHKVPSGYNATVKPPPEPGDPKFQYTAMGMGAGQGRRVLSGDRKHQSFNLAGGVGMLIDVAGCDAYDSSNFSQGCGYFFGVGLKLDLAGDDTHGAARYGHAAGAHYGMGLFVDDAGCDRYTSTGPTYNCGCAWDHSVFLFVDAGSGPDVYDLGRSAGPARADIKAWGVAVDMAGDDRYVVPRGVGRASRGGLAAFLDAGGTDVYERGSTREDKSLGDGQTLPQPEGGLFVDLAD